MIASPPMMANFIIYHGPYSIIILEQSLNLSQKSNLGF